jgi:hypothetical protein
MKKYILIANLILFSVLHSKIEAQDLQADSKKSLSVVAYFGHQDDLFKFQNSTVNKYHNISLRPLFIGGIQKTWIQKTKFRFYQDAVATYHIHPYQERTIGLGTDFGFEFLAFKKIILNPKIGAHYNYAKYADVQYGYVNDKWVSVDNTYGKSNRMVIKLGIETGYRLNNKVDIIAGVSGNVLAPYAKDVLALFLHYGMYGGVRYGI